jgi:hypothetical protein
MQQAPRDRYTIGAVRPSEWACGLPYPVADVTVLTARPLATLTRRPEPETGDRARSL